MKERGYWIKRHHETIESLLNMVSSKKVPDKGLTKDSI
jgi:hypothetical protein